MKRSLLFLLLFLLFILQAPFYLYAVDNLRQPDIRSISLGGNEVTQSVLFNPSLVALSTAPTLHVGFFNRFQIKELSQLFCRFTYPNEWLSAGIDISSFGCDSYRDSHFRLSVGKRLDEQWSLGIAVQYRLVQSTLFEQSPSFLSADIGVSWLPVDHLLIGVLMKDLPSVCIHNNHSDNKPFTNYLVQAGFQWEVINKLFIISSLGTEKEETLIANVGVEYAPFDCFHLRAGMRTAPLLPSFGMGFCFSRFVVDAAVQYHTQLGVCSGLEIGFRF